MAFNMDMLPENPYLLLTPGPLSTSKAVKAAMLGDYCTWDSDYNNLVQEIRQRLVDLATAKTDDYTAVLMQGSGTFSVEAVIGSVIPWDGKLLVLANGAYGRRIVRIAEILGIDTVVIDGGDLDPPNLDLLRNALADDNGISHVAMVHNETTTGILNPVEAIGKVVKQAGKVFIVDAMSSFGGIPMDAAVIGADFLVSSANKCLQGAPGFGFIIARTSELKKCKGWARSLSLDLYDQWQAMEEGGGKWRFTSPTHVVRAFYQALKELDEEGGINVRYQRYCLNQRTLRSGMAALGFKSVISEQYQSPVITTFCYPDSARFSFQEFYDVLKKNGFIIYPGKVSSADVFRIGNIGTVYPADIGRLIKVIAENRFWLE